MFDFMDQPGPEGGLSAFVGWQGSTKPEGAGSHAHATMT
jgi:hypothetical protein